jgi:15-cis-phytoene synthase
VLTPLYAFWHELRTTIDTCAEFEIARTKLAWWHDETQHMLTGRPRHPVTKALAPVVTHYELPADSLHAPIEALAQRTVPTPYENYAALRDYGLRARGSIEQLAARLVGLRETVVDTAVAEIGARLELSTLLRDVGADAARKRCYLPREELARFGVSTDDLYARATSESVHALLRFHAKRVRTEIDEPLARLLAPHRASLRALLADAEIARRLLARIEHDGAQILREPPTLLPVRQLFIAWRASRRAVRGHHAS